MKHKAILLAATVMTAAFIPASQAQQSCTGENCAGASVQGQASGQTAEQVAPAQGQKAGAEIKTQQSGSGAEVKTQQSGEQAQSGQDAAPTKKDAAGSEQKSDQQQTAEKPKEGEASGQAKAGGDVELSSEQKQEAKSAFSEVKVKHVNIDFDLSIGFAVPRTIVLQPVPARIITLVPAYQGYLFFVTADGQIVIVAPDTHQIVYVIV